MSRDDINYTIKEILIKDGPDGHIDGHEEITEFIMALLDGQGEAWSEKYLKRE